VARIGEAAAGQERSSLLEASSPSGWLWNPTDAKPTRADECGNDDGTPRRTAADAMAQGGRRTRGHPHNRGVVMGGRPIAGNLAGVATRDEQRRGIWGKRGLTGGPRLSVTVAR
jgi:hypothetical protein